ncbi:MAG: hypothetical protein HRU18_01385 [Pseudoalteromonas sp.]|uniref:hypothetical protein n=1 Tax=Pseudoalteromonas sp. TaxID=53249 RepID=UPI001DD37B6D|nr:hypothetical protein [Pseudoalteromonas sp.]NRA76833.1 hypothetical protein [Pseudoalteromonas sp.]
MKNNILITTEYLDSREKATIKAGYSSPKWIGYCREVMSKGIRVEMYEAKSTVSKYIYSIQGNKVFKVRFSNHRPNKFKQQMNDCDFFVGVSNGLVTRTEDALKATMEYFSIRN